MTLGPRRGSLSALTTPELLSADWIRSDALELHERSLALRQRSAQLRAEARALREKLNRFLNETRDLRSHREPEDVQRVRRQSESR